MRIAGHGGVRGLEADRVAGESELPSGIDPVGVVEGAPVRLPLAEVQVDDLGVAVAVAEVPLGEVPQGVASLDRDRGPRVTVRCVVTRNGGLRHRERRAR